MLGIGAASGPAASVNSDARNRFSRSPCISENVYMRCTQNKDDVVRLLIAIEHGRRSTDDWLASAGSLGDPRMQKAKWCLSFPCWN